MLWMSIVPNSAVGPSMDSAGVSPVVKEVLVEHMGEEGQLCSTWTECPSRDIIRASSLARVEFPQVFG